MYRVYDERTDETLYTSNDGIDCMYWINRNVDEDSRDYDHIFMERIKE
jgi:hypothetical protein